MRLMAERSVGVIDQVEPNTRTRALALWVSFAMENLVYNSAPGVGAMQVCCVCVCVCVLSHIIRCVMCVCVCVVCHIVEAMGLSDTVHTSAMQCVAVGFSVLQCIAVCFSVLQLVVACCSVGLSDTPHTPVTQMQDPRIQPFAHPTLHTCFLTPYTHLQGHRETR